MAFRPTSLDLTAGVLVAVAVLVWSVWGAREFRRPRPATAAPKPPSAETVPPAVPASVAVPAPSDEARRLLSEIRQERGDRRAELYARWPARRVAGELLPEILAFIREALRANPEDPAPLALLAAVPGAAVGDALLEFASPAFSKVIRLQSLGELSERGYREEQIRKAAVLFDGERDEDLQVAILLGISKSSSPAAEALARKGLTDRSETVRSVALSTLDPENPLDRSLVVGLARSDPSDQVRRSATLQLHERTADPAVLEALLSVALKDACDENRKTAVLMLGKDALRGDERVLEALQSAATRDPFEEVRRAARSVLDAARAGK